MKAIDSLLKKEEHPFQMDANQFLTTTPLQELNTELNKTNVDEEHVLALLGQLSNAEKSEVLSENNTYLKRMAECLEASTEMKSALELLGAPLGQKIYWLIQSDWESIGDDVGGKLIRDLIDQASPEEVFNLAFDDRTRTLMENELSNYSMTIINQKINACQEPYIYKEQEHKIALNKLKAVNNDDWTTWVVDDLVSNKASNLAENFKEKSQKRAEYDPTNGDPENKNRWVRVSTDEVLKAIQVLNPSANLNSIKKGEKIKIPTLDYWVGHTLEYYLPLKKYPDYKTIVQVSSHLPLLSKDIKQEPTLKSRDTQFLSQDKLQATRNGPKISPIDLGMWSLRKLGPYQDQLRESATSNQIPMQMLAALILTELGDIDSLTDSDQIAGSIGIAQIQPETAKQHNLVDLSSTTNVGKETELTTKLKIPQYAIEAAARELAYQLKELDKNKRKEWALKHGYAGGGPRGEASTEDVLGDNYVDQLASLTEMVVAAYNSPDIAKTDTIENYPNGAKHGKNASYVANFIALTNLFKP